MNMFIIGQTVQHTVSECFGMKTVKISPSVVFAVISILNAA